MISESEKVLRRAGHYCFEYRQEVCGNAPKPDNTNIQIKGFEADSTDAFYFGCNIFASERYVVKMSNTLMTKSMPGKYFGR